MEDIEGNWYEDDEIFGRLISRKITSPLIISILNGSACSIKQK